MTERIGFIGLGRMGQRMATRLLDAGLQVTVYDVVEEKSQPLSQHGAQVAASPGALGESEVVVSSVTDGPAVLSALQGAEGLLSAARPGLLLIEMSTIGVEDSKRVAAACDVAGVRYVRSPVLGTLDSAAAGKLTALASGPREWFDAALPVLSHLTACQHYLGSSEEGRIMKLLYNAMLGTTIASLGEVLVLGRKSGLNVEQLLDVIDGSSVASPALKGTMQALREHRFEPRLTTSLMAKDLRLLNELAASTATPVPIASSSLQLYEAAANMGWAEQDTSAVVLLIQALSGLTKSD